MPPQNRLHKGYKRNLRVTTGIFQKRVQAYRSLFLSLIISYVIKVSRILKILQTCAIYLKKISIIRPRFLNSAHLIIVYGELKFAGPVD